MGKVSKVLMGKILMLQLFASMEEVAAANVEAFKDGASQKSFTDLSAKLGELGYDVLLNNKQKAEFVPSTRLGEVVNQRDGFKTQVTDLNKQLLALQIGAKGNEELQKTYQTLIDQNSGLLKDMDKLKIESAIIAEAKDAIDVKDVLAFIDIESLKINKSGEVAGVAAEIARIKQAKPYLFGAAGTGGKGGTDHSKGAAGGAAIDMNSAIRRAAGRV